MGCRLALVFALLYFASIVIEAADHQKRDVHHRIIIKEQRPRRVARPSIRDHDHHRDGRKKEKKHRHKEESVEEESYEDNSDESRDERSYENKESREEGHRKKKNVSKHHKHRNHVHKKEKHGHSYRDDSRESKRHHREPINKYHNDWRPISSETSSMMDQIFHETRPFSSKYKKNKKDKKHHHRGVGSLPYEIDITTMYPSYTPYQFDSTVYPPLGPFPSFQNQKIFQANQAPLIGTIEQFGKSEYADLEEKTKKLVGSGPQKEFAFVESNKSITVNNKPYEVQEMASSNVVQVKVNPDSSTATPIKKEEPKIQNEPVKIEQKMPGVRGRIRMRAKPKTV